MTRKIDKTGSKSSIGTDSITSAEAVKSQKIESVSDVQGTRGVSSVKRLRQPTRPMTVEERTKLFSLVQEESEKMFGGPNGLPEKQKEKVTKAVEMTIRASETPEENKE